LTDERNRFQNTIKYFQSITVNQLLRNRHNLEGLSRSLKQESQFLIDQQVNDIARISVELQRQTNSLIRQQEQALDSLQNNVRMLDPTNILKRGFSITLLNGKAIKNSAEIKIDDTITTILADGQIISDVKNIKEAE
jgi:exodeoxyribonuclease VII large subunit